ncbi:DUF427 domain-containing protein [Dactylosporangium sp. AC04546]|uniref:DUF427 domain-containing protein n=1 Tax=Dactylosporangium sp. AC04546 TaxID=2862460 RepID=UPI001EDF1576|nr:DUF427 domain-containing protein [Dactylosporangium sp. AC04546]WVK87651.1 DUF427 domain-containing protein [Dactylosporangium sp. AC04546]
MSRPHLVPGPDHPITIEPSNARVVVRVGEQVIADTHDALTLQEATYPPVYYIPLSDVDGSALQRTDHTTYCPYKGDASYYSIGDLENVVWSYETPYPEVSPIEKRVAFYTNRVELTVVNS